MGHSIASVSTRLQHTVRAHAPSTQEKYEQFIAQRIAIPPTCLDWSRSGLKRNGYLKLCCKTMVPGSGLQNVDPSLPFFCFPLFEHAGKSCGPMRTLLEMQCLLAWLCKDWQSSMYVCSPPPCHGDSSLASYCMLLARNAGVRLDGCRVLFSNTNAAHTPFAIA